MRGPDLVLPTSDCANGDTHRSSRARACSQPPTSCSCACTQDCLTNWWPLPSVPETWPRRSPAQNLQLCEVIRGNRCRQSGCAIRTYQVADPGGVRRERPHVTACTIPRRHCPHASPLGPIGRLRKAVPGGFAGTAQWLRRGFFVPQTKSSRRSEAEQTQIHGSQRRRVARTLMGESRPTDRSNGNSSRHRGRFGGRTLRWLRLRQICGVLEPTLSDIEAAPRQA